MFSRSRSKRFHPTFTGRRGCSHVLVHGDQPAKTRAAVACLDLLALVGWLLAATRPIEKFFVNAISESKRLLASGKPISLVSRREGPFGPQHPILIETSQLAGWLRGDLLVAAHWTFQTLDITPRAVPATFQIGPRIAGIGLLELRET
jgi:hypothetical protein